MQPLSHLYFMQEHLTINSFRLKEGKQALEPAKSDKSVSLNTDTYIKTHTQAPPTQFLDRTGAFMSRVKIWWTLTTDRKNRDYNTKARKLLTFTFAQNVYIN